MSTTRASSVPRASSSEPGLVKRERVLDGL
jgi:hypothetical protein